MDQWHSSHSQNYAPNWYPIPGVPRRHQTGYARSVMTPNNAQSFDQVLEIPPLVFSSAVCFPGFHVSEKLKRCCASVSFSCGVFVSPFSVHYHFSPSLLFDCAFVSLSIFFFLFFFFFENSDNLESPWTICFINTYTCSVE